LEPVRGVYRRYDQPAWSDDEALWAGVGLDRQRILRIEEQVEGIMGDEILVSGLYGSFEQLVRRWNQEGVAVNPAQRRRK